MTVETGTVKFFKPEAEKLFGFIIADKGGEVFFHFNNHENYDEPHRKPKSEGGDRVEFTRTEGKPGKGPKASAWNFDPYVSYPDLCHSRLGTTSQVGAYYVGGCDPYPDLSVGIRFQGDAAMYHSLRIHKDDVDRFVARVKKWEAAKLANRNRLVLIYYHPTEKKYFFSTKWQQPNLPPGFVSKTFALPQTTAHNWEITEGMVTNRLELVACNVFFVYTDMREIPNPIPEFQDPESPLVLNTVG